MTSSGIARSGWLPASPPPPDVPLRPLPPVPPDAQVTALAFSVTLPHADGSDRNSATASPDANARHHPRDAARTPRPTAFARSIFTSTPPPTSRALQGT